MDLSLLTFGHLVFHELSNDAIFNRRVEVRIRKSDNIPKGLSNSKYTLYIQGATTVEILQLTCKGFYEKFINQIQTASQLYWEK